MNSDDEAIRKCIDGLKAKFCASGDSKLAQVFLQIQKDFPYDVGSLSLFFLNLIELQAGNFSFDFSLDVSLNNIKFTGDSIFLAAKIPHAYLSGDCIECMACSDNVVRAGLTPKFKDVENLLSMLVYDGAAPEAKLFQPTQLDKYTWLFKPPVEDFAVAKIQVPSGVANYDVKNSQFGSIILIISGTASMSADGMNTLNVNRGKIIFLPSRVGPTVKLENIISDDGNKFTCYQAMFNDF